MAIVGSVKAYGRLELRTIREVDAAENRLTELQHWILKRKTDRCSMTDGTTNRALRWRWKSLVCEGVVVHGLARLHLLRNNWFWPNDLNKHPSTPRLTRVSKSSTGPIERGETPPIAIHSNILTT